MLYSPHLNGACHREQIVNKCSACLTERLFGSKIRKVGCIYEMIMAKAEWPERFVNDRKR